MGNITIVLHHHFLSQLIRIVDASPHHDVGTVLRIILLDGLRNNGDIISLLRSLLD